MVGVKGNYKVEHEKKELCPQLLVSELLDVLFKKGIINFSTYEKAKKEVGYKNGHTISE